ncbi:hypothetical protein BLNAU_2639 [Blattamonas nauphoetae]|uniref:Sister chromatid cohesion C-terminal domain-containing protein n=1 Tax=Blattamonas nauphoetae TaxID=2049346 RepID=A0ABQ9YF44_9EUKA|nr:hypothetical protein BLNAU_2639 [Blattamonas nauphoetae]
MALMIIQRTGTLYSYRSSLSIVSSNFCPYLQCGHHGHHILNDPTSFFLCSINSLNTIIINFQQLVPTFREDSVPHNPRRTVSVLFSRLVAQCLSSSLASSPFFTYNAHYVIRYTQMLYWQDYPLPLEPTITKDPSLFDELPQLPSQTGGKKENTFVEGMETLHQAVEELNLCFGEGHCEQMSLWLNGLPGRPVSVATKATQMRALLTIFQSERARLLKSTRLHIMQKDVQFRGLGNTNQKVKRAEPSFSSRRNVVKPKSVKKPKLAMDSSDNFSQSSGESSSPATSVPVKARQTQQQTPPARTGSLSALLMQTFLRPITNGAVDFQSEEMRWASVEVIGVGLKDGIIHPSTIIPSLVCVILDPVQKNADLAFSHLQTSILAHSGGKPKKTSNKAVNIAEDALLAMGFTQRPKKASLSGWISLDDEVEVHLDVSEIGTQKKVAVKRDKFGQSMEVSLPVSIQTTTELQRKGGDEKGGMTIDRLIVIVDELQELVDEEESGMSGAAILVKQIEDALGQKKTKTPRKKAAKPKQASKKRKKERDDWSEENSDSEFFERKSLPVRSTRNKRTSRKEAYPRC